MIVNKALIKAIATVLIILLLVPGCSRKQEETSPKQMSQQSQKSDEIPSQLKDIESGIEKIIKTLNGPAVETEEDKKKESTGGTQGKTGQQQSGESKGGSDQQSGGGGQGGGSQGGTSQGGGQQTQQQVQPPDPWKQIDPVINKLHYQWSSYTPMAVKMRASRQLIDNFSNALNNLTNTIISKNSTNTLLAASNLYSYVPDFYMLYRTEASPEIKRIRYYTRDAILNSMTANWAQSDTDMNNLKASWSLFKNTSSSDNQDMYNTLDLSIYELDKVIKARNQPLSDIKGRVIMSNIAELEKSMEKGKGGKSGQGSSQRSGQSSGQGGQSSGQSSGQGSQGSGQGSSQSSS